MTETLYLTIKLSPRGLREVLCGELLTPPDAERSEMKLFFQNNDTWSSDQGLENPLIVATRQWNPWFKTLKQRQPKLVFGSEFYGENNHAFPPRLVLCRKNDPLPEREHNSGSIHISYRGIDDIEPNAADRAGEVKRDLGKFDFHGITYLGASSPLDQILLTDLRGSKKGGSKKGSWVEGLLLKG